MGDKNAKEANRVAMNKWGEQPEAAESPFPVPVSEDGTGAEAGKWPCKVQLGSDMPFATSNANAMQNKASGIHGALLNVAISLR